jgi:hypothetical protein
MAKNLKEIFNDLEMNGFFLGDVEYVVSARNADVNCSCIKPKIKGKKSSRRLVEMVSRQVKAGFKMNVEQVNAVLYSRRNTAPEALVTHRPNSEGYFEYDVSFDLKSRTARCGGTGATLFPQMYGDIQKIIEEDGWQAVNYPLRFASARDLQEE